VIEEQENAHMKRVVALIGEAFLASFETLFVRLETMKGKLEQVVIACLFLVLILSSPAIAQDRPLQPFVIAEVVTIHSKILGEDRTILIYNPDKNGANLLPSYPVLYMLDENDMTMVTGLVKYLSSYTQTCLPC
jgi:hypothetical protein